MDLPLAHILMTREQRSTSTAPFQVDEHSLVISHLLEPG